MSRCMMRFSCRYDSARRSGKITCDGGARRAKSSTAHPLATGMGASWECRRDGRGKRARGGRERRRGANHVEDGDLGDAALLKGADDVAEVAWMRGESVRWATRAHNLWPHERLGRVGRSAALGRWGPAYATRLRSLRTSAGKFLNEVDPKLIGKSGEATNEVRVVQLHDEGEFPVHLRRRGARRAVSGCGAGHLHEGGL